MKIFAIAMILSALVNGASAQTGPHPARMKACAAEWQAKKRSDSHLKTRYQDFMSGCMRRKAAIAPAHS